MTELINERWSFLHTESMGIAYFIDPKTKTGLDMAGTDRIDTLFQLKNFIHKKTKMCDDVEKVYNEINEFVD